MKSKNTKKYILYAVFGALAGAMQAAENFIFSPVPIPGGKPGLANIVTMTVLEIAGTGYAFAVAVLKSLVAMLATGSVTGFVYSVLGGVVSVLIMSLTKKTKRFSLVGIGIAGAVSNNVVQCAVGSIIMQNVYVLSYIWVLGVVSVVFGIFTGLCTKYITEKGLIKI